MMPASSVALDAKRKESQENDHNARRKTYTQPPALGCFFVDAHGRDCFKNTKTQDEDEDDEDEDEEEDSVSNELSSRLI